MPEDTKKIVDKAIKNLVTKRDIDQAIKNLQEALFESLEASKCETEAKQRKIRAHYQLNLAREAVRALSFNE